METADIAPGQYESAAGDRRDQQGLSLQPASEHGGELQLGADAGAGAVHGLLR